MRRGVQAREDANTRDQLAWLVLRLVAELTPCTTASLIAHVSGDAPTTKPEHAAYDAYRAEPILEALSRLSTLALIQFDKEQIVTTNDGRRFLDELPLSAARAHIPKSNFFGKPVHPRLAEYIPHFKQAYQSCLARARTVAPSRFLGHADRARALATQVWCRKTAPTVGSVVRTLRNHLIQLAASPRLKIWLVGLAHWRRQALVWLRNVSNASGLPWNGKIPGLGQSTVFASGLLVSVLLTAASVAFLASDKRPEDAQETPTILVFDGQEGRSPGERDALSVLMDPPERIDAMARGGAGHRQAAVAVMDPTILDLRPEVVAPPKIDPIVAAVRATLADPTPGKGTHPKDLAALKDFYNQHSGAPLWITDHGLTTAGEAVIGEIRNADDWGLAAAAFDLPAMDPRPETEDALAADEIKLSLAVLKYARFARGGRLSPSRISALFDQRPPLRDPAEVISEIAVSAEPDVYLQGLHPKHTQFERLRQALLKARAQATSRGENPPLRRDVQRLVINMERWRWMPASLGSYHVWNNIPAFNARVVKQGKTIYTEKTIVGQLKYATPIFSDTMRSIVFHPQWTVPPTILREDLEPSLKQGGFFGGASTAILRKHNFRVSYRGEPVDAETIDWVSANVREYTFTQPPGPNNVLGTLKFNFPNRHAIYMHDTPQRELFAETERTLSHGCIRVHQPQRLATLLLAEDKGWSAERVHGLLATPKTNAVKLSRPVPVHLTYFTVTVDETGTQEIFADVYGLDGRMASALFGTATGFQAPAAVAKANALDEERKRETSSLAAETRGLANAIRGLFGN